MSQPDKTTRVRHALVLCFDTFGDLALRQPLLAALLDRDFRVTLVLRRAYEHIVPFLDSRLASHAIDFDPYLPGSPDWERQLAELANALRALAPDFLVCAPFNRTSADDALLASFSDIPSYVLATGPAPHALRRHVMATENTPELAKNQALFLALTGDPAPLPLPSLALGDDARARARVVMDRLGLERGAFAIGAPAGTVTTAIKAWPAEEFADTVAYLGERHALRVLMIGVASEAEHLERIAALALERNTRAEVFIGGPDDLGTLLGLLAAARLYVGSDSGPMHFAAALDVPVFARFGGGHWPRFLPATERGVVATQKLPCFGCGWICWLNEPACIRLVTPATIRRGLDEILLGRAGLRIDEGAQIEPLAAEMIRDGATRHREFVASFQQQLAASEADRAARLQVIEDQQVRLGVRDREIFEREQQVAASEADRAARLQVIEEQQAWIGARDRQYSELGQQLAASEADRAARLQVIEEQQARLAARDREIFEREQQVAVSEADRAARLQLIEDLEQQFAASEADRTARLQVIEEQQRQLGARDRQLMELQQHLAASEADRAARLEIIHQYARQIRDQQERLESLRREAVYLSTTDGAVRVLGGASLRRLRLYDFARRYRRGLNRLLSPVTRPPESPVPTPPTAPALESSARAGPTALEAIPTAHALASGVHELALERLYESGRRVERTLCVGDSQGMLVAAYLLASGGAQVTLLGRNVPAGLSVPGLTSDARAFGDWLAEGGGLLTRFAAIVLDQDCDAETRELLTSRLAADTRVLVLGRLPESLSGTAYVTRAPGLFELERSPVAWVERADVLPSGRPWPRITIVTVSFNHAAFLEQTLRSVLDQGYPNLEYIVVDGGSTDGSREILDAYRDRLAWCVSEPDRGQSHALNKGFARATGSILAWLNSDDRYPPGALRRAAIAFDVYETDMVAGGCALVDNATGDVTRVHHSALPVGRPSPLPLERLLDIDGSWLQGNFFFQPEVFWTRALWERSGAAVAEELHYSMDYDLWVRFALHGARIVHIPDLLALYRVHDGQKTAGEDLPYLPELRRVAAGFVAAGSRR